MAKRKPDLPEINRPPFSIGILIENRQKKRDFQFRFLVFISIQNCFWFPYLNYFIKMIRVFNYLKRRTVTFLYIFLMTPSYLILED